MSTRRQFIASTAAGLVSAVSARSASPRARFSSRGLGCAAIKSIKLRDDTIIRRTQVNGDNWHLTWAGDGRQYASMCDGYGWFERPLGVYNSRLVAIEGNPSDAVFHDVPGYPELAHPLSDKSPRYYGFGVISIDGCVYQFLSTWNAPIAGDVAGLRFIGVKAILSPDGGQTWRNQDGSAPVVWESWHERSRKSMLFLEESQEAFSILSVLQMGKNYEHNRDGYVYIYAPNGNTEGTMNELVLFRARKERILDRSEYEYFSGQRLSGSAKWTKDIDGRRVVLKFPSGWVNKWLHPWAWVPSIVYNPALKIYMMTSWATAPDKSPDAKWFDAPSYLGFWIAPEPWGPWMQMYESTAWLPGNDLSARCYSAVIAPKWIAADGKSFWLVWTDFQHTLTPEQLLARQREVAKLVGGDRMRAEAELDRLNRPYYSFNVQRLDIKV